MSPVLISLDGLQIRYFSLLYAVSLILLFIQVRANLKDTSIRITRDELLNWLIIVFVYGIIGARSYYVMFNLDFYFDPGEKWYEFLAIWNGGLGMTGGILLASFALWVLCNNKKIRFSDFSDQLVSPLFLTLTLVSIGSFINSGSLEIMLNGESTTIFRMMFRDDSAFKELYHPTELYESILYITGYFFFSLIRLNRFKSGFLSCCCLFYYCLVKVALSFTQQGGLSLLGINESLIAGIFGGLAAVIFLLAGKRYRKQVRERRQYPSTRKWTI